MKRTQLSAALVLFVLALTLSPSWALAQDSEFQETRSRAEQGDADAQSQLGGMYGTGEGVPENDAEAVKWFRKAAEQGEAIAQFNLGIAYATGEGVPEDDAEAVKWYRLAAEQGDASAQYRLGGMYNYGEGVPEDSVRAYAWYNLAAAQGSEASEIGKNNLRQRMTPDQIARAQELSTTLFEQINESQ